MHCIYCTSLNIYPVQTRKTKTGTKQIFRCIDCKHRHTPNEGFHRFRHSPTIIALSIGLRAQKVSLGKICKLLSQQFDIQISRKTILDWEKKFSQKRDLIIRYQQPLTDENLI